MYKRPDYNNYRLSWGGRLRLCLKKGTNSHLLSGSPFSEAAPAASSPPVAPARQGGGRWELVGTSAPEEKGRFHLSSAASPAGAPQAGLGGEEGDCRRLARSSRLAALGFSLGPALWRAGLLRALCVPNTWLGSGPSFRWFGGFDTGEGR